MTTALHAAIVRIKTADNIIVGAGFLIAERQILTCAHVINAALQKPTTTKLVEAVHLDFPFIAPQQTLTAQVVFWQPKRPDSTGDIAGLELTGLLPDGVKPVALTIAQNTWGHTFRAFGFPPNHDDGVWASGVLRDKKANGHIQIEDVKTPGYAVQHGFSGTPVWDDEVQRTVGMIVTAERQTGVKAAFMIPATNLIEAWPLLKMQRAFSHQRSEDVPTVEAPLLIGMLVDVSGSIVTALRKNSSVPKADLGEAIDLLIRKIVEVCQTDNSTKALPKIALFAYGFGFGRLKKGFDHLLQTIGLVAPSESTGEKTSEAVRDLFADTAQRHKLPTSPDASLLQKYSKQYKQGMREQLADTELGPSLLYDGLRQVYLRLCQEIEKPYYPYPLLIVITDGQFEGADHDDVIAICQQITELGVSLAFCYIGMQDVTLPKTLYAAPSPKWPPEARFLYKLSSPLTQDSVLLRGLADEATTRGWHIPENARLFLQVNQSEEIAEFVELLLSKLHG